MWKSFIRNFSREKFEPFWVKSLAAAFFGIDVVVLIFVYNEKRTTCFVYLCEENIDMLHWFYSQYKHKQTPEKVEIIFNVDVDDNEFDLFDVKHSGIQK